MIFWILYLISSLGLSILISFFFKNGFLKALFFSFTLALFSTVWFTSPEKSTLAPIFSIFLLESTISENNGFERIFRPFILSFIVFFLISFLIWRKTRN